MAKKISIIGSTGSIGKQALEVIENLEGRFEVFALAAGNNIETLSEQINKFNPEVVSVKDKNTADKLKNICSKPVEILYGEDGLTEIAKNRTNDLVLMSVTGFAGLKPTLAAIENKITVALANKETLVAAGSLVMQKAKENNVQILPVDSEHSAIFQCLGTKTDSQVNKLIITGSGGPFRTKTLQEIENASVAETLKHPNWSMGDKITVDSATLMNKGLEVIEAHWMFGIDYKDIEVVIHPQSIIHGAVEFVDGSLIAQLGVPSMHIPIQYALTYPERQSGLKTESLSLTDLAGLTFEKPDLERFPCLRLAYEAGMKGGTYPAVLNAINEVAVYGFLEGKIKLTDIYKIVEKGLEQHENIASPELEDIINADNQARKFANSLISKI